MAAPTPPPAPWQPDRSSSNVYGLEYNHQRPCCKSVTECNEKTIVAAHNALFGGPDPIPAESTWTHILPNFKKTLLRRAVHRIGINAWPVKRGEICSGWTFENCYKFSMNSKTKYICACNPTQFQKTYLKGYALCRRLLWASRGCQLGGSVPPF